MAKFEMHGMDVYIRQLENVAKATPDVCKAAVYAGTEIVADEIKAGLNGLKTTSEELAMRAWQKGEPTYITTRQKEGLLKGFGISPIREDMSTFDAKVGFDGYNDVVTKHWPKGQPNVVIARACESGKTYIKKQPFVRRAVDRVRPQVIPAMEKAADKKIKEVIGGTQNG